MENNKEAKCERCGRVFGAATWTADSVREYNEILKKTGYKVLCETCTFQVKKNITDFEEHHGRKPTVIARGEKMKEQKLETEKETELDFPTPFTQMMPQFKEKPKEQKLETEEVVEKENKPIKEKEDKRLKEIKDSRLLIKIPTTEFMGRDGQMYRKLEWVEPPAGEVNLGSLKNPKNGHILGFKWTAPQKRKERPFEGLFKMFGGGD